MLSGRLKTRAACSSRAAVVFSWVVVVGFSHISPAFADTTALILSGVPGSDEHRERFAEWTDLTRSALIDRFNFAPDAVMVLADREARADDIRNAFADLGQRLGPDDTFFLFFIGHGSWDRQDYKFNIMGADLTSGDYNTMISALPAGRVVVVNGTNSSGGAIESLRGDNRVIVTATRSGTEQNDPLFYEYFLNALTDPAADEDRNERMSVWEVFRYATLEIERFYAEEGRLATEHAQISDNGGDPTGTAPDELPLLARIIEIDRDVEVVVSDPVLRGLLDEQAALEREIEALRLAEATMVAQEFDARLEDLLLQLALKNRQIRQQEGPQ